MSMSEIIARLRPDSEVVSARIQELSEALEAQPAAPDGMSSELPPEFERLVYAVEALRAGDQPMALQFMGVAGAEGATLVASSFARAAACTQPQPVLFLDCRAEGGKPGLVEAVRKGRRLSAAIKPVEGQPNLAWARLAARAPSLVGRGGTEIGALLDTVRESYPIVVLDAPGASPYAKALSRLCDGTILVVEAGRTQAAAARAAKVEIEQFGGQVIGSVLNRHRDMLPSWLARRLG